MIDWSTEVLAPCMDTFARPAVVTPLVSQPGQPAYPCRGIWARHNIDVAMQDGIMSSAELSFDVREVEFAVQPAPGDKLTVDGKTYLIDDTDPDGNGGSRWTLKEI
ncbi:MAG: hypothetical protein AB7U62_04360 [Pseudolabrys sp.]